MNNQTIRNVANRMLIELNRRGELYQEDAVSVIRREFGSEFIYTNDNGNDAISKDVLKEFRRITEENVIWNRSERMWRIKNANDPVGRLED